jgi:alpha-tubulin suppressor-like RCC1 family protein
VAIAAGDWHNFALRSDGSLVGWGGRNFEINGISVEVDFRQTTVPAGNDFVAIASGDFHGVALKSDGSLAGLS